MKEFLTEQPVISGEGPRRDLARQVAEWIHTQPIANKDLPARRGHVAGIYGSRGSGKTSFLLTLLEALRERSKLESQGITSDDPAQREHRSVLVLPTAEGVHSHQAIFKPSETRAQDGLLLMLVDHLCQQYPPLAETASESNGKAVESIKKAEIQTKEIKPFLEYAKETSPSDASLERKYVALLTAAATTTATIRSEFAELLGVLCPQGRLVLFIDDVDLQPHRALELLELLHLFLDRPNVFIIVAADKQLLLHAIDQEIKRNRTHQAGLAAALLSKYVPYSWHLPVPTREEFKDKLLMPWWSSDRLSSLLRPNLGSSRSDEGNGTVVDARTALEGVWPTTYREINALVNVLRAWRLRIVPNAPLDNSDDVAFHDAIEARYNGEFGLGLPRPLAPPYLTLLAAVDTRWPDLGLLEALECEPARLMSALSSQWFKDPEIPTPAPSQDISLELPVLTTLRDENLYSPARRGQARRVLWHVVEVLEAWRKVNAAAGIAERFLFVTLHSNANVLNTFRPLWESQLTEEEASRAHLDLHTFARAGMPNGEQVREAVEHARPLLDDLVRSRGRLWLCAVAPLSLMAWLGASMDYNRPVVAWNAGEFAALDVPLRLQPLDRGGYYDVTDAPRWVGEHHDGHANVIFDFLGRSVAHQLEAFPPRGGRADNDIAHNSILGCRLVYHGGNNFNFDDVEAILVDVLELLGELRERGVTTLHVGMDMPNVVAFALGRQLSSRGLTIVLYELIGARYERSVTLEG
ncbi:MAG: P-loop NTPase fold protein [Kofleriaceae bacterium]